MRAFIAFVKKEFMEGTRTFKLLIVFLVFLLFGMVNPVMAKVMPDLLASFLPEGMTVTIPTPSAMDSWTQFYKNMPMQLILFFIMFSGILTNEISQGTLINMLTKGLSRKTVISAKLITMISIWTFSYGICFAVTYGYTRYLLPGELPHVFVSAFYMWLYGVLLITVMLFGSALFSNLYGSLLMVGVFVVVTMVLSIFPDMQKWNPYQLASRNMKLLSNTLATSDFFLSMIVSCILLLGFSIGTFFLFDKKRL